MPCLLVLFSLDVLRTIWCRLVCRNSVELNFVKTGLKCKFGVNPHSFSHELCLYITRFFQVPREPRERVTHISQSAYRIPSNDGRECVATAVKICLFSGLRSSLLRLDCTFVLAWICTEDMWGSHLQGKGR